jgi:hypothetical protein
LSQLVTPERKEGLRRRLLLPYLTAFNYRESTTFNHTLFLKHPLKHEQTPETAVVS